MRRLLALAREMRARGARLQRLKGSSNRPHFVKFEISRQLLHPVAKQIQTAYTWPVISTGDVKRSHLSIAAIADRLFEIADEQFARLVCA